jgi:primosomal protein N' (replication factor Y)
VPSRARERAGWPLVDVVDRRGDDPRSGLYSDRLVDLVRSGRTVVCVLNRKGRGRLLACASCGEVARCERCGAAVEQPGEGLRCRSCGMERPVVCLGCTSQRLRLLRAGVSRAREELEALVGAPVAEVSADTVEAPATSVVVGTEAALHRLRRADAVAFLDFDQELLAPRFRAAEQALALLARAGRLVGGRAGRVLVQTRLPGHEVLDAALHADPGRLASAEQARRVALGLPPETALAEVSGPQAEAFVAGLPSSVEVLGPHAGRWRVRAPDHATLCDALASVPRPPGRLRVEVDPQRS